MFGIILVEESAAELHADLVQNPHVAQVRVDLPDAEELELLGGPGRAFRAALDAAIAEYARLVEDQPKDWATANLLGDPSLQRRFSAESVRRMARFTPEATFTEVEAVPGRSLRLGVRGSIADRIEHARRLDAGLAP